MKFIIVDSREKPKKIERILSQFDEAGVPYEVSKLMIGDYMDWNRPNLVVDRKHNIAELAKNCTLDHERFRRELERVKAVGAELVVLVEQDRFKNGSKWVYPKEISDLMTWSNPHTMVRGEKVFRVLSSWCATYPLRVEFCNKKKTGERILEILYKERKK